MDKTSWSFLRKSIFVIWNRGHSVEVCSQEQYDPQVIIFQVARLIHEWMEEKLQTYSSKDTECCKIQDTESCKLTFLFSAWSESHESWAAMPPKVMVLIKIYQFQVPDHEELLGKWPRCETNIY